jgi:hypothetical protein
LWPENSVCFQIKNLLPHIANIVVDGLQETTRRWNFEYFTAHFLQDISLTILILLLCYQATLVPCWHELIVTSVVKRTF